MEVGYNSLLSLEGKIPFTLMHGLILRDNYIKLSWYSIYLL